MSKNAFNQENEIIIAFEAQNKGKLRNMTKLNGRVVRNSYIASNCSKEFFYHLKQHRNLIRDCLKYSQNGRSNLFNFLCMSNKMCLLL